ncbi:MAG: hypothetical protein ABIX01_08240 [Chitinophagaceae bacterium]
MRVPRRLAIISIIVMLVVFSMQLLKSKDEASIYDIPKKLEDTKMKLRVWFHSKPSGAEVFSISKSGSEDDRLYLEPAKASLAIPPGFFTMLKDSGYTLQLYGQFYKGKGIPARFLDIQPKPERYPVFRYENLDLLKEQ